MNAVPVPPQPKIYHIAHVDRLPSIVADGFLWCDAEIVRRMPPGTTIGAVIRDDQVLIAHDDTRIESGDHVILFLVDKKHIRDVERLFQAGLTFF